MFYALKDRANELVKEIFEENEITDFVRAEQVGLDERAGYKLYICDEFVAVEIYNGSSFEYYSGFSYIDKNDTMTIGNWKFYFAGNGRVDSVIEMWREFA